MPADSVPAPTILAGLKQVLRPHVPFGAMEDGDLDRIVRTARLRYFAPGETILHPSAERPPHCYIVKQGIVRGERPGGPAMGRASGNSRRARCFRWARCSATVG